MTESIHDKIARFSNMGGNKPKPEQPKRVFTMPVEPEPVKKGGHLMDLLDEVDRTHSKKGVVR